MALKKRRIKKVKEVSIREIVQEEMRKSLVREKHIMNSESIIEYNKYYKTAKQKLMLDLLKPSFNAIIKDSFAQNIASRVLQSIIKKF
jgi:hypothetical protein